MFQVYKNGIISTKGTRVRKNCVYVKITCVRRHMHVQICTDFWYAEICLQYHATLLAARLK